MVELDPLQQPLPHFPFNRQVLDRMKKLGWSTLLDAEGNGALVLAEKEVSAALLASFSKTAERIEEKVPWFNSSLPESWCVLSDTGDRKCLGVHIGLRAWRILNLHTFGSPAKLVRKKNSDFRALPKIGRKTTRELIAVKAAALALGTPGGIEFLWEGFWVPAELKALAPLHNWKTPGDFAASTKLQITRIIRDGASASVMDAYHEVKRRSGPSSPKSFWPGTRIKIGTRLRRFLRKGQGIRTDSQLLSLRLADLRSFSGMGTKTVRQLQALQKAVRLRNGLKEPIKGHRQPMIAAKPASAHDQVMHRLAQWEITDPAEFLSFPKSRAAKILSPFGAPEVLDILLRASFGSSRSNPKWPEMNRSRVSVWREMAKRAQYLIGNAEPDFAWLMPDYVAKAIKGESLVEIGNRHGLTHERIRQRTNMARAWLLLDPVVFAGVALLDHAVRNGEVFWQRKYLTRVFGSANPEPLELIQDFLGAPFIPASVWGRRSWKRKAVRLPQGSTSFPEFVRSFQCTEVHKLRSILMEMGGVELADDGPYAPSSIRPMAPSKRRYKRRSVAQK